MKKIILLVVIILASCKTKNPTQFSKESLNDTFITLNGESQSFKDILDQYKGKRILIDVWASWCGDCIKGMPKVEQLQAENLDVIYLFLSLDKTIEEWETGIKKYKVKGEHYFMQSGWKGDFGSFLGLDWIPRYVVVNEQGEIDLFKAVEAGDERILDALKK
ncbi:thiol-disulfide isomerase/thioredoxin [Tenacibaculum adriaticum]|uniref:Thiol-disulfide isomerase/thioredoxin n=1 Tax=Tenacibaculum adriaticum TaxID=413713 RepID=A0A5S5DSG2_9FLAO|nr:TlpA disulfide reductase family protein [Tenacibaculum adriaticum]TYP97956.1 thiol-disulfide isomerase/thioredoxin [Tenacibaculum adriaticum]